VPETRVQLEIAFEGGQIIGAWVEPDVADALAQALAGSGNGAFELTAEDGIYVIPLRGVVYAKRQARDARAAGFGRSE
jgi:hypothetical protein